MSDLDTAFPRADLQSLYPDPESDQGGGVSRFLLDFEPASPPRKRRRGGKIYSGCGTCRTRKIKCDERRPRCYNCERSRLYACDGYGEESTAGSGFPSAPDMFDWTQNFPFSDVALASRPPDVTSEHIREAELVPWESLGDFMSAFSESPPRDLRPHNPRQRGGGPGQHLDHDGHTNQTVIAAGSHESPRHSLSLVDPTLTSDAARRLLDHYRTHVSGLMMPTSAPSNNPWLQVYLPLAMKEPSSLPQQILLHAILAVAAFNWSYLASDKKTADLKQGRQYYGRAVTLLRTFLDSGDLSSEVGHDTTARQSLMAAALTLTTVEVFSGAHGGDGYDHLHLCKRVIELTGGFKWWLSDPTCVTIVQIFRCLQIVAMTSGRLEASERDPEELALHDRSAEAERSPESSASTGRDSAAAPVSPGSYPLDVTFGVSMKTLRCLDQIAELSRIKSAIPRGGSWPADKIPALVSLEAELFETLEETEASADHESPYPNPLGNVSNYIGEVMKENHILAFQYSAAIYFRRALCDGSARITPSVAGRPGEEKPRPTGQFLVSKALDYLENIDALSRNIAAANTLWPGFVAAVEAVDTDLRHRALIWLARAKRHGIGNIAQATSLLMEVWRRVDRQFVASRDQDGLQFELGSVDWREVMREKRMYIMLT